MFYIKFLPLFSESIQWQYPFASIFPIKSILFDSEYGRKTIKVRNWRFIDFWDLFFKNGCLLLGNRKFEQTAKLSYRLLNSCYLPCERGQNFPIVFLHLIVWNLAFRGQFLANHKDKRTDVPGWNRLNLLIQEIRLVKQACKN
ncbi:MAG: hypothetical protein HC913_04965 [Microscillaceae bacterium]|nr:hypothetical protein [Microscillaceae bacterium]